MADVKWIKITTDIFDDEKILLIESLPDSYAIITVWFKLLCLAGKQNNSGVFMMGRIAYTDKMLATIFRMKEATVTMALKTFEQFGMVEIVDGVITIPNWNKHQTLDAYEKKKERDRMYQAERRANQRALVAKSSEESSDISSDSQVIPSSDVVVSDKEEDKDIDIEEDKDNKPGKKAGKKPIKRKHGEFQNVLLTDQEIERLADDFGSDQLRKAISFLDAYIEEKGYKSKSHNLAIRRWVMDAVKENEAKPKRYGGRKEPVPGWCKQPEMGDAEMDAIKRLMNNNPATVGNDPELADRAEKLRQQLQG